MQKSNLTGLTQLQQVMAYAAELELEVDRLRGRDQFLSDAIHEHLKQTIHLCKDASQPQGPGTSSERILQHCAKLKELLRDVNEPAGYHPSFDQVIAIAIQPLAEQVFRWQQRLSGARNAILRLDLQPDHIVWFPGRLRHILDNLISNALRYSDPAKGEIRVSLALRVLNDGYEIRITDNGLGMPDNQSTRMLELFYRAAPTRAAGLGVGLAVVKFLVEQCCGTISMGSGEGQGTSVVIVLPRYDLEDHLN